MNGKAGESRGRLFTNQVNREAGYTQGRLFVRRVIHKAGESQGRLFAAGRSWQVIRGSLIAAGQSQARYS